MQGCGQPWLDVALLAGLSLAGAAGGSPAPSSAELDANAAAESSRVVSAVRTRLERESAGDVAGARLAAHDAETHRARFLELSRDIERRLSPLPSSLSLDASGRSLGRASMVQAPAEAPPLSAGRSERESLPSPPMPYSAWDMYRPHALTASEDTPARSETGADAPLPAGELRVARTTDLYATRHGDAGRDDAGKSVRERSVRAPSSEAPRSPWLVYRARRDRDETRE